MEQENKNIEETQEVKYDIGIVLLWSIIFLVVGLWVGSLITKSYVSVGDEVMVYTKMQFGEPTVQYKFVLKDTIITTTERVTIVDKCVKKDTLISHKESIPSPYIIVTTDKTNGGIKFFSVTKQEFYTLKKGANFESWLFEEINNPINCK